LLLVILATSVAASESIVLFQIVPLLYRIVPSSSDHKADAALDSTSITSGTAFEPFTSTFTLTEGSLASLAIVLLLVIGAKTLLQIFTSWKTFECQWNLISTWSNKILDHYIQADHFFSVRSKRGVMLSNITIETRVAGIGIRDGITMLCQLLLSLAYIAVLFATSWQITVFQLLTIAGITAAMWGITHKLSIGMGRKILQSKQRVEHYAAESLAALRQIKASAIEADVTRQFNLTTQDMSQQMIKQATYLSIPKPVSELVVVILVILTCLFISLFAETSLSQQLPFVALFIVIANRLFISLGRVATSYMAFIGSLPALELIRELITSSNTPPMPADASLPDNFQVSRDIHFKSVGLKHAGQENPLFEKLDFSIRSGKLTVLVGESGGGKSTIIDLLLGFITPDQGKITIGSLDYTRDLHQSFRRRVGYVSQDIFLFNSSIKDNFLTHKPDASMDDIISACDRAHISEYIEKLPKQYDTEVGDRGGLMSGGQRQRLAIAIALLRDPDIYLFDEATNAMDPLTETAVSNTIRELHGKTVLLVTHRIADNLQPDFIYELSKGKISQRK